MSARRFKVVVATWHSIALVLRAPLHAPALDVGSEAQNYGLRCERPVVSSRVERVAPGSPGSLYCGIRVQAVPNVFNRLNFLNELNCLRGRYSLGPNRSDRFGEFDTESGTLTHFASNADLAAHPGDKPFYDIETHSRACVFFL